MKYRLGKNLGENSLKDYLKRQLFVLSKIADHLELSGNGFEDYLAGRVKRPRREVLEKLAEYTGMSFGIDKDGPYFEPVEESIEIAESTITDSDSAAALTDEEKKVLILMEHFSIEELQTLLELATLVGEEERKTAMKLIKMLTRKGKINNMKD